MRLLRDLEALTNRSRRSEVETFCVFDEQRDCYILMYAGWNNGKRHIGMTLCLRLRNGKIWIEEDWTEDGIATQLVEAGVPKEEIVLAFNPPEMRHLTEFAVA
jgi:hypothetical protein